MMSSTPQARERRRTYLKKTQYEANGVNSVIFRSQNSLQIEGSLISKSYEIRLHMEFAPWGYLLIITIT